MKNRLFLIFLILAMTVCFYSVLSMNQISYSKTKENKEGIFSFLFKDTIEEIKTGIEIANEINWDQNKSEEVILNPNYITIIRLKKTILKNEFFIIPIKTREEIELEKSKVEMPIPVNTINVNEEIDKQVEEDNIIRITSAQPQVVEQVQEEVNVQVITEKPRYNIVKTIGNVPEYRVSLAEEQLALIPEHIVNQFINDGWNIYITTEKLAKKYFDGIYKNVMGVTVDWERTIYITNTESAIRGSLLHEFGHYIDYINGYPSLNAEFYDIYLSEVDTFKSIVPNPGAVSSPTEAFAHTFQFMIKDRSVCTDRMVEFVNRYI